MNYQKEYTEAPEAKMLADARFDEISKMTEDDFKMLSPEDRKSYFSTRKWYYGQRQIITDLDGIVIGKKSAKEILQQTKPLPK